MNNIKTKLYILFRTFLLNTTCLSGILLQCELQAQLSYIYRPGCHPERRYISAQTLRQQVLSSYCNTFFSEPTIGKTERKFVVMCHFLILVPIQNLGAVVVVIVWQLVGFTTTYPMHSLIYLLTIERSTHSPITVLHDLVCVNLFLNIAEILFTLR